MKKIKSKTAYLCSSCGDDFSKWFGQCPSCKEWDTLSSFKVKTKNKIRKLGDRRSKPLKDLLVIKQDERISTNIKEVDRVLGGGLLHGSFILLGGSQALGSQHSLSTCALISNNYVCIYLQKKVSSKLHFVQNG